MAVPPARARSGSRDLWRALAQRVGPAATVLPVLLVASALLAACGTDGGSDPLTTPVVGEAAPSLEAVDEASTPDTPPTDIPPTDTPPTDTPPTDIQPTVTSGGPPGGPPAVLVNTGSKTGRSSGGAPLVLTDVRTADHEAFERIVLEFSGAGTPGWSADYVARAALEGSGDTVGLDGDSTLNLFASNSTWPASDYYSGPRRLDSESGGVTEVYIAGTFEGYTQVLAGIDGPRAPFRVFALTHPSRLVVDVVRVVRGGVD